MKNDDDSYKILFILYVLTCFICIFIKFYKLSGKHHRNLNTNANLYNINKPSLYKLEDKPTSRFGIIRINRDITTVIYIIIGRVVLTYFFILYLI